MESISIARLDHLGIISAVMKDLGLIDLINARLVPDAQEVLTPGEAMAGMILNGLGFANRPLSLTPQFFANQPLARLFREGIHLAARVGMAIRRISRSSRRERRRCWRLFRRPRARGL
jgi:transposase